jgi:hypothetical protein
MPIATPFFCVYVYDLSIEDVVVVGTHTHPHESGVNIDGEGTRIGARVLIVQTMRSLLCLRRSKVARVRN